MAVTLGTPRIITNGRQRTDAEVKSFGRFLTAVRDGRPHEIEKQGGVYTKVLDSTSGNAGGWLVPVEYTTRFFKSLAERALVYPRALVVPMNSAETKGPMLDATTARAAATAPFFGGIVALWGNHNQTYTTSASEPQFRELTLTAFDLLCYAVASNQLLADLPPDADEKLMANFGQAIMWYAEWAWLRGLGASNSMPLGMLNAPCCIDVTRAGAGTIANTDCANMVGRLLPMSQASAVWACSPSAYAKVSIITSFQPNAYYQGPSSGQCIGYLHSLPLFITDKLPAVGTRGDLMLFDPSLYVIGDRMQVVVDVSKEAYVSATVNTFQTNQSMFRTWVRMDGKPMLSGVVTLPDASTTASSIIAITT